MSELKVPDFGDLASDLALSGPPVSREDFEEAPDVKYIRHSADIGKIVLALRQAYLDGWRAGKSKDDE